jgi:rhodanese-related sulfurtransferase
MLTIILLIIAGGIIQITLVDSNNGISSESIQKLSPQEFDKIIANDSVFVVNVHTPYYGKIEGTDLVIEDWRNIENYLDEFPEDSKAVAVYCRSGSMSAEVAEKLRERGYKVYDLDGGMNAWVESGRELIV